MSEAGVYILQACFDLYPKLIMTRKTVKPSNPLPSPNPIRQDYISLEELAALPSYYAPAANWKGDRIAFYSDKSGRIELYLLELKTRQIKQLTNGQAPRSVRSNLCWSHSGREVVFGKDFDGDENHDLFAIDVESCEIRQIIHDPTSQEYPVEFSPDDQWLSVLSNRNGQLNLWKIKPDGTEYTPLTAYFNPVLSGGNWSPDGRWLAFNVNQSNDLLNFDGYLIRADGTDPLQGGRLIFRVREGADDQVGSWHPSGKQIAVTSDASGVPRPGILDLETNEVRWLGGPEDASIGETSGKFSHDGRWLACERNYEAELRSVLYEVATGKRRELHLPPGQALATDWLLDDSALLIYLVTEDRRPERGLYWLDSDRYEPLLPAEYGKLDPTRFAAGKHFYYPSSDKRPIPALLYHPHKLPTQHKLPAIIVVHGGPTDQHFRVFDPFVQVLVDRGYVVLEPNVRGSTGYGVEFRDAALYDWGGGDLEDVIAGANYLKSLSYVDPERLAIFGGSYGGYMTYVALTQRPDLFKAGVAWAGITDLPQLYEDVPVHFKYYLRQQLGDPKEKDDLWHNRSPINFAHNVTAHLLMLQGENDPRTPLNQASVFRDRLVALGRRDNNDFEFAVLGDEGHGSEDVEQKIRVFKLLVDFLARKL